MPSRPGDTGAGRPAWLFAGEGAMSLELGNWAEWVTAVVTALALIAALLLALQPEEPAIRSGDAAGTPMRDAAG